ncbi:MAG: hypothetical protein GKR99_16935 [Rhodobacteraceae bacterium]|nr:hypothetical protein [Paracoccaceae bacterium]
MKNRSLLIAALSLLTSAAQAQTTADVARLDVVHGYRMSDGHHMAALQITMAPGWHTYWRTPGEVGIPPQFSWQGSDNVAAVSMHWPVPQTFRSNGYRSIGYENSLLLPVEVVARGSGPIRFSGEMTFGVCEEICVPVTLPFSAELTQAASAPHGGIDSALQNRPSGRKQARVTSVDCTLTPTSDGLHLSASVTMPSLGSDEMAVVELPDPTVWVSGGATVRRGNVITTETELVPTDAGAFALNRSDIRITVIGDGRAVDIRGCG